MKTRRRYLAVVTVVLIHCTSYDQSDAAADPEALRNKHLLKTTYVIEGRICLKGGVMIESGRDANANGVLDASEVVDSLTRYKCNDDAYGPDAQVETHKIWMMEKK